MSDRGTISPLIAAYLSLVLSVAIGAASVGIAIVAGHRVQGVADFALLHAHDRSVTAGKVDESKLEANLADFLTSAPSAAGLEVLVADLETDGEISRLRLCARYRGVLGLGFDSFIVCRQSSAKSYLVP